MLKYFRIILVASVALLLSCVADARFPRGTVSGGGGAPVFTHVPIGGAGATIGISSVPSSNAFISRTDQFNCYLSVSGSQWTPLLRTDNTPVGNAAIDATGNPIGNGCDEGVIDPSNVQNLWVMANGRVFLSSDQGTSFGNTCYPTQTYGDGYSFAQTPGLKNFSPFIAVDPANSNIVYMSLLGTGVSTTFDKGVNCFTIGTGTIGTATAAPSASSPALGGYLIAFDSSGGTTATCPHSASICTKNIYISTYGTGVYKSTDAGVTWALTTSTPTTHIALKADHLGNIWFLDNSNSNGLGALRKYNGTSWSTPSVPTTFGAGLAIDPNRCSLTSNCHIVMMLGGGPGAAGTTYTVDGGSSWNTAQTITTANGDMPWLADFINAGFGNFPAGAAFDSTGVVYTGGEGVFKITPPTSGSAVTWTPFTAGIEESLSSSVITSPTTSGKVALATWDLNCFVQLAQPYTSFPTTASNRGCYATNGTGLQHTYNMDWASANTSFFVALSDNQAGYGGGGSYANYSGTSTDGGATWSALTAPATVSSGIGGGALKGGCIAASSSTNYLWAPTDGSQGYVPPYYTTNSGSTWTPISVTGSTETITTNATTASGNATLHFASVPAGVTIGMSVYNNTSPATLQANTTVASKTSTTVVLNKTAQGAGVGSSDLIVVSGGGWGFNYFNRNHFCTVDRVTANVFYLYNFNDGVTGDAIYKCTSGGASCALQSRPSLGADSQYNGLIKSVPGNAGHLFASNATAPFDGTGGTLKYYTDGGITPNTVANFTDVLALGFGAAFAGHTYPAIVVVGWYNGVYGIWQSIDWDGAKTWQQIGPYPKNLGLQIYDVDGDKVIPNVFYYTTISGLFCSAPSTSYCNGGT